MKKWVVILAVCLVFVTGTAWAYNSITIVVNGKTVASDVSPFIKDGRTMVPLRVVSESLGADVEWDSDTQTVNIISDSSKDANNLKAMSRVVGQYYLLEHLGNRITNLDYSLDNVLNEIRLSNSIEYLNTVDQRAEDINAEYNVMADVVRAFIVQSAEDGIYITDMDEILNDYYKALDYYDAARTSLINYYKTSSPSDYDDFFANRKVLFDSSVNGAIAASTRATTYLAQIQKY